MLQNISSVTLHSKASMPQSAHSTSPGCVLALVSGWIGRAAGCVCVVPSGPCHAFSQFRSFLQHFLLPAFHLKHLSSQFSPIFLCLSDVSPPVCRVPCLPFFLISNGFLLSWMVFLPYQHQHFLDTQSSSFSGFYVLCRAVFTDCRMACLSKRLPGCTLWSSSFRSVLQSGFCSPARPSWGFLKVHGEHWH